MPCNVCGRVHAHMHTCTHAHREVALRAAFAKVGVVSDARIPRNYHTQQPQSFGFVRFEEEAAAEKALQTLDGASLSGNVLIVRWARGQRKTTAYMQGTFILGYMNAYMHAYVSSSRTACM